MFTAVLYVAAAAAWVTVAGIIVALAMAFARRHETGPGPRYEPRHDSRHDSKAERIPSPGELAAWREDWTGAELAALHDDPPLPPLPAPPWSLHRWQREQDSWLEARRREAHEQQLILKAQLWADPFWLRQ